MRGILFLFFLSLVTVSCRKAAISDTVSNSKETLQQFLGNKNGLVITEFIEEGVNKTTEFSGYKFHFSNNGTVKALKSGEEINGTYFVIPDGPKLELKMTFPAGSILFELSDDWYFISMDSSSLKFEDNSDTIHFQKL